MDLKRCSTFITERTGIVITPEQLSTSLAFSVTQIQNKSIIQILNTTTITKAKLDNAGDCMLCCNQNYCECGIYYDEDKTDCFDRCLEELGRINIGK